MHNHLSPLDNAGINTGINTHTEYLCMHTEMYIHLCTILLTQLLSNEYYTTIPEVLAIKTLWPSLTEWKMSH